jgi:beta-1,4-mannosyl-glycoprotein beta-1,4-N-acetylglucosaminyltransferase
MKVYDCFIFYNELDVLDIRLHELNEIVDYFVLVESTHTFTGIPKPLFYNENKQLFSKFSDKIIHIISENPFEESQKHWERESFQRNQILSGLNQSELNDLIIISDVDEIPKANIVKKHINTNTIITCELIHCSVYLNRYYGHWINGTRIFKKHKLTTPQKNRFDLHQIEPQAGWHFGYLGDAKHIVNKLSSFSHIEYNVFPYNDIEYMRQKIQNGENILGDNEICYTLPNQYLPKYVQSNLDKFDNMIFKCENLTKPEDVSRRT